jgi:hypothetical protein
MTPMPWRSEPEIPSERQAFLAERCMTQANIEAGTFAFRDVNGSIRLERADIEWLVAVTPPHMALAANVGSASTAV